MTMGFKEAGPNSRTPTNWHDHRCELQPPGPGGLL